ncbi:hypothetical protein EK904_009900 [Melospiza melodia maxima]|nr:hypothetical protein EK904_009900 [Melospiza melodia maxima]
MLLSKYFSLDGCHLSATLVCQKFSLALALRRLGNAREGLVSRALSLPPNPGSHKGTKAVHCRRPLVSAGLLKEPLARTLDGSSCFIRMAQHWLLLSSFVFMYACEKPRAPCSKNNL